MSTNDERAPLLGLSHDMVINTYASQRAVSLLQPLSFGDTHPTVDDDPTSVVPTQLWITHVLGRLEAKDLARACVVSHRWKRMCNHQDLWSGLYMAKYREPPLAFANYKFEYWMRAMEMEEEDDFDSVDVPIHIGPELIRKERLCHRWFHNRWHDAIGYTLLMMFSVLFPLKLDNVVTASWPIVYIPMFLSCFMFIVRAVTLLVPNNPVLRVASARWDPKITARGGFLHCFASYHKERRVAIAYAFGLSLLLIAFIVLSCVRLSHPTFTDGQVGWTLVFLPLLLFFAGLFQASLCGCATWRGIRKGKNLLIAVLMGPLCLFFIFVALRLDDIVDWDWWAVASPTWLLYSVLIMGYVAIWLSVLKDTLVVKKSGCWKAFGRGLSFFVFAFIFFGPLIAFEVLALSKATTDRSLKWWVIFLPLQVFEAMAFPGTIWMWRRVY